MRATRHINTRRKFCVVSWNFQNKSAHGLAAIIEQVLETPEPDALMHAEEVTGNIARYRAIVKDISPGDCSILLHPRWSGRILPTAHHVRAVLV